MNSHPFRSARSSSGRAAGGMAPAASLVLLRARGRMFKTELEDRTRRGQGLEHECENESDKDRLATVEAMLAGYQLSFWLPGGWRNIIMLLIVVFAVLGGVLVHWYWGFLLLLATIFSPRLMGEVAFFLGSLSGGPKSR